MLREKGGGKAIVHLADWISSPHCHQPLLLDSWALLDARSISI